MTADVQLQEAQQGKNKEFEEKREQDAAAPCGGDNRHEASAQKPEHDCAAGMALEGCTGEDEYGNPAKSEWDPCKRRKIKYSDKWINDTAASYDKFQKQDGWNEWYSWKQNRNTTRAGDGKKKSPARKNVDKKKATPWGKAQCTANKSFDAWQNADAMLPQVQRLVNAVREVKRNRLKAGIKALAKPKPTCIASISNPADDDDIEPYVLEGYAGGHESQTGGKAKSNKDKKKNAKGKTESKAAILKEDEKLLDDAIARSEREAAEQDKSETSKVAPAAQTSGSAAKVARKEIDANGVKRLTNLSAEGKQAMLRLLEKNNDVEDELQKADQRRAIEALMNRYRVPPD